MIDVYPLYYATLLLYKGEFFEPFYLELEFVDKTIKVHNFCAEEFNSCVLYTLYLSSVVDLHVYVVAPLLQPCWHTIPVFVPLGSFVERYNKNEIHVRVTHITLTVAHTCTHTYTHTSTVLYTAVCNSYLPESFHSSQTTDR